MIPRVSLLIAGLTANLAAAVPDFTREIRPILSDRCYKCHGPGEAKSGLRLDQRGEAIDVLNVEDPVHSEFLNRITASDPDDRMPPAGKAKALTQTEIAKLQAWTAAGATYQQHWAYVKPTRAALPAASNISSPIDAFVRAKLAEAELLASREADPAILIRRLGLDLVGLPPSLEEVDRFVRAYTGAEGEAREVVYAEAVDRLLASPHFGERWARWWLDLARYADTNGFQHDEFRPVWPYRDWVIRAFNADMPFDQFTVEQLAGDLLPNPTVDQKVATAFNRNTPANCSGGIALEESRTNILHDRVATLGTVWLGTTLECAQCHDHKFDPVTARDYYAIFATFNSSVPEIQYENQAIGMGKKVVAGARVTLPTSPDREATYQLRRDELDTLEATLNGMKDTMLAQLPAWEDQLIASGKIRELTKGVAFLIEGTPRESRTPEERDEVHEAFFRAHPETKSLLQKMDRLKASVAEVAPPECLTMEELPQPRESFVFQRGNYLTPGEQVNPGTIAAFHPRDPALPSNRLGLARWIVSPENPLVARVTVNRLWHEIFGRGIVTTTEDFGFQSTPPTHPELLDWLAVEFMENGWSIKQLLRQMVRSRTYRQSSDATPELLQRDPENAFFARGPRFRISAEAIRDNALSIAGLLSRDMFGPPVHPPQPEGLWSEIPSASDKHYVVSTGGDRHRRGLYTVWRRGAPYPSFMAFDASRRDFCVTRRERSNTPLQALTLLNDPVYVEAAEVFARRIAAFPGSPEDQLRRAFRTCVAREPSAEELRALTAFHERKSAETGGRNVWFHVAQVLLNLDEAITKR